MKINREELDKVEKELEYSALTLTHVGRIFGQQFWQLIVICLLDSRSVIKADNIQVTINEK